MNLLANFLLMLGMTLLIIMSRSACVSTNVEEMKRRISIHVPGVRSFLDSGCWSMDGETIVSSSHFPRSSVSEAL